MTQKPMSVASIEAFIADAHAALSEKPPDADEARKQLSAARAMLAMFGHEIKEASLAEVMSGLHDGAACVNGRSFEVVSVQHREIRNSVHVKRRVDMTPPEGSPLFRPVMLHDAVEITLRLITKYD